jgi:hypothetical protein
LAAASAASGLVLAAHVLPAGLPAAASSMTTTAHHTSAPKLDAFGAVKFWECPPKTRQTTPGATVEGTATWNQDKQNRSKGPAGLVQHLDHRRQALQFPHPSVV